MTWINAHDQAVLHAQQDADFGRLLASLIFIVLVVAVAYWATDERRKDRL